MRPTIAGQGTAPTDNAERLHVLEVDGSHIVVLDAGRGETALLGHSYLWSAEMWRPQIEALARHYRVIVPNLWGHGGSEPLPETMRDMGALARQHLAVMDALGIEHFAVCGLSVGGMWAFELACLAPHRVKVMALLDTFIGPEPEPSRRRFFDMLDAVAAMGSSTCSNSSVASPLATTSCSPPSAASSNSPPSAS